MKSGASSSPGRESQVRLVPDLARRCADQDPLSSRAIRQAGCNRTPVRRWTRPIPSAAPTYHGLAATTAIGSPARGEYAFRPDDREPARRRLVDPRRDRAARRGRRLRDPLSVRPLRVVPRPCGQAHDRCLGHDRGPRARDLHLAARDDGLAGHVPTSGQRGQGRGHHRRDERRSRGARPGRRLERSRTHAPRPGLPRLDHSHRDDGGAVPGRARLLDRGAGLVIPRGALHGGGHAVRAQARTDSRGSR